MPVSVILAERNYIFPRAYPIVAVGGEVQMRLYCSSGGNELLDLDLPFNVDDGGGPAVRAKKVDSHIELTGVVKGSNKVHVFGPYFDTRPEFEARVADAIELIPEELNLKSFVPWVWTAGVHKFALPVTGGGAVLSGLAPIAMFNGTTVQYQIDVAAPGDYSISSQAGDLLVDLPFTVADHADSVSMDKPDTQLTRSTTPVCFGAYLADGRRLLGVNWTFMVVNAMVQSESGECVWLNTTAAQAGQTAQITASGAGASMAVSVPII